MDLLKMGRFKKATNKAATTTTTASLSAASASASASTSSPPPPPNAQNETNHHQAEDEDDEDDFITNEVKRRLKELRKNSFMVLIPEADAEEESDAADDQALQEDDAAAAFDFGLGLEGLNAWLCGFDALYDKYCQRMLFFDRLILASMPSATDTDNAPSASKLASTLRFNLSSFKSPSPSPSPSPSLEAAYVAHLSLSWEALHSQHAQLTLNISSPQPHHCTPPFSYTRAAQAFQHFHVLLQRFIETEPFQPGSRVHIYARSRTHLSKLLQVPNFQALDRGPQPTDDTQPPVLATHLLKLLQDSILTFRLFLKKDKTKSPPHTTASASSSLHQVQASLHKKETRVKELFKKKKGWESKTWPRSPEEAELVFALIDLKVVARVLRMAQLSKEQLLWCEEKMSKIDLSSEGKLRRDPSPILFPCGTNQLSSLC